MTYTSNLYTEADILSCYWSRLIIVKLCHSQSGSCSVLVIFVVGNLFMREFYCSSGPFGYIPYCGDMCGLIVMCNLGFADV